MSSIPLSKMRINQYLAACGLGSRRKVEDLISQKQVIINGQIAKLTDYVQPESDVIKVKNRILKMTKKALFLFHKPQGVVCSLVKQSDDPIIRDYFPKNQPYLFPVGRLDKQSSGLLLLTNDGNLALKLSHPRYFHQKEYKVQVHGTDLSSRMKLLSQFSLLDGIKLAPFKISKIKIQNSEATFNLTLTQGLNHQIKRMADRVGLTVNNIKRLRIDQYQLGDLKAGQMKEILLKE